MSRELNAKQFFIDLSKDSPIRFDMASFMLFDVDVFDPITSNVWASIKGLASGGQYTVAGDDFRPDQVSNKIYGSPDYWWIILIYNEKLSFNDLQHGDELQFPSVQALEDLYFGLKIKQNKVDKEA